MFNPFRKSEFSLTKTFHKERCFIAILAALFVACAFLYPYPSIAMWLGFGIAGYSAIANDSIQTLGTFLSSNRKAPWWLLWLFFGGILVTTHTFGWFTDAGDIAFDRLDRIPQPTSFTTLSLAAPVILVMLTRLRMPVSTTFLLLSTFSSAVVIQKMLLKTFLGYIVAFAVAIVVWSIIGWFFHRRGFNNHNGNGAVWKVLQALSTAYLWIAWIMHDTANIAVFLPRSLGPEQLLLAVGYLFAMMGVLMYKRGGHIQVVVTEKTDITTTKPATIIDFIYGTVLVVFKQVNNIPMSTTWVFLGLLAGREIALTLMTKKQTYERTLKLVGKDIIRAGLGLLISLLIVVLMIE